MTLIILYSLGGKDFSVVFEPLASATGLKTPLQVELDAAKAENAKLREELEALKNSGKK
jgi:hypothetical protein